MPRYRFFMNGHSTCFRTDTPPYQRFETLNLNTGKWANLGHRAQHYEDLGEVPISEIEHAIRTWGEPGVSYQIEPNGPVIKL